MNITFLHRNSCIDFSWILLADVQQPAEPWR